MDWANFIRICFSNNFVIPMSKSRCYIRHFQYVYVRSITQATTAYTSRWPYLYLILVAIGSTIELIWAVWNNYCRLTTLMDRPMCSLAIIFVGLSLPSPCALGMDPLQTLLLHHKRWAMMIGDVDCGSLFGVDRKGKEPPLFESSTYAQFSFSFWWPPSSWI